MAASDIYRILVIGQEATGKTSIIRRLTHNIFSPDHEPTIEDTYETKINIDNQLCKIVLYDVPLQILKLDKIKDGPSMANILRRYKSESLLNNRYIDICDACVVVYSVVDFHSFVKLKKIVHKLQQQRTNLNIYIVGSKADLAENRSFTRALPFEYAFTRNIPIYEISSKNNYDVANTMTSIVKKTRARKLRTLIKSQTMPDLRKPEIPSKHSNQRLYQTVKIKNINELLIQTRPTRSSSIS